MITKVRDKGQVTIPAKIRESLHLAKDSVLSVTRVGNGVLLFPSPSVFESVSAKFTRETKAQGITLKELLKDLKKIRAGRGSREPDSSTRQS